MSIEQTKTAEAAQQLEPFQPIDHFALAAGYIAQAKLELERGAAAVAALAERARGLASGLWPHVAAAETLSRIAESVFGYCSSPDKDVEVRGA